MDKVVEDMVCYELDKPSSDHFFLVSLNMKERERTKLIYFLKQNIEIFAWTLYEMLGIDPSFIKMSSMVEHVDTVIKKKG